MIGDSTSNVNFFDIKYQMRLNDMADLDNWSWRPFHIMNTLKQYLAND